MTRDTKDVQSLVIRLHPILNDKVSVAPLDSCYTTVALTPLPLLVASTGEQNQMILLPEGAIPWRMISDRTVTALLGHRTESDPPLSPPIIYILCLICTLSVG